MQQRHAPMISLHPRFVCVRAGKRIQRQGQTDAGRSGARQDLLILSIVSRFSTENQKLLSIMALSKGFILLQVRGQVGRDHPPSKRAKSTGLKVLRDDGEAAIT